jgi:hypothetical protein
MGLIRKLFPPSHPSGNFHSFSVRCKRCGETIRGHVNLNNEPSLELNEKGKPYYVCRKVLVGSGHCFQQIEVHFKFNEDRHILDKEIIGGEFVEE